MNISENSRIWIYQANRILSETEKQKIQQKLDNFTSQWQAHGHSLAAHGEIRHKQFIILSVDEQVAGATGCSIDKSVYLMKEIENEFNLDLFDRFRIAYRDGENVINCSRKEFEDLLDRGDLNSDTIVFNNMVSTRKDLLTSWEVPVKNSWHGSVFADKISWI
ncbi:MAG: ABC transporter ATPase [Daejeonella sp.]|uniref:ABC transporter ATPase n=1 Tax=Daejeonella sp. JGW-45 TaxID=3034148 RepID=UPI0023EDE2CA|nr:ABC transporter ATPase [Daejeonella sp. JGW-45]